MQISKKADYALRAIVTLASLPPEQTMQARELAKIGNVPIKFLEQIMLVLKRAGLVISKRGVGGGSRIGRESRLISVADVIQTVDGDLCQLLEVTENYPDFPGAEGLTFYLQGVAKEVNEKLHSISIEDLLRHGQGDAMAGFGI